MILIFLNITLLAKSEFSLFSIVLLSLAAISALITFIFFRINLAKRVADTKKVFLNLSLKTARGTIMTFVRE